MKSNRTKHTVLGVQAFDDAGHWTYQPSNSDELTNVTGNRVVVDVAHTW
ncbi:hypothetical protein [Kribbella lupini]|uniref:Uncharacterized protein n=1 Tax=Kribbella lupini TaxID=291602 RepID=A0ABP4NI43_9ACTN